MTFMLFVSSQKYNSASHIASASASDPTIEVTYTQNSYQILFSFESQNSGDEFKDRAEIIDFATAEKAGTKNSPLQ